MKNLLILSLLISLTQIHAMDHDIPEGTAHPSQTTDSTDTPIDLHLEMFAITKKLALSRDCVAQLRVKAIALESVVRTSVPGFKEFELLSKLNFKTDQKSKATLTAYLDFKFKKQFVSQEERELALESMDALTEITHEEMVLKQAIHQIESIISEHSPMPNRCELL